MDVALAALIGAAVGGVVASYLGVVIERGWMASTEGRSRCDGCGRTLRWFELVPVGSYLALRGRCRTCGASLSVAHLVREVLGVGLGAAVGAVIVLALAR